jgi:beta-galactosidase
LEIQNGYPGASHQEAIKRYYNALNRRGVNVDILQPGDDLSGYRLVLAPHLHVLSDDVANQLVEYVRDGGVLLTDCRTGVKDETNLAYARTLPGLLAPALGIEIEEYESLGLGIQDKAETTYSIQSDSLGGKYTAIRYADWIKSTGAERIARYDQSQLKPYAAVTRNQFGKGIGWYVGTIVDKPEFYDKLVAQLLDDAEVRPLVTSPQGVEISVRSNQDRRLLFVINHTDQAATVNVPSGQQELLSKTTTGESLTLDGFGVAVIELPAADREAGK